jgi:lysophospholipase L1-like esterase
MSEENREEGVPTNVAPSEEDDAPVTDPPPRKRGRLSGCLGYCIFLLVTVAVLVRLGEFLVGIYLPPIGFAPDGHAHAPYQILNIQFHDFTYRVVTNEVGMREDPLEPKQEGTYRIAAIGDSYTYGWGVAIEEVWHQRLEHYLQEDGLNVEILNCGYPGAGPWEYAEQAAIAVNELNPDMLLVELLQGNDLEQAPPRLTISNYFPHIVRLYDEMNRPPFDKQTEPWESPVEDYTTWLKWCAKDHTSKWTPEQQARFDALDEDVQQLYEAGMINPWMIDTAIKQEVMFPSFVSREDSRMGPHIDVVANIFTEMRRRAQAIDAKVVSVSLPNGVFDNKPMFDRLVRMGHQLPPEIMFSTLADEFGQEAADRAGIPFVQVSQAFRDRSDDPSLYFEMDHHYTPAGHDLLAKEITPIIAEKIRADLAAN